MKKIISFVVQFVFFVHLLHSLFFSAAVYAEYEYMSGAEMAELFLSETYLYDIAEEKPTEGECGEGVKWTLEADGNLIIEGEGHITSGWKEDARIKNVFILEGIRSVCESAFEGCFNIKTVYLPESIYRIGKKAFSGCGGLEWINLSSNINSLGSEAFSGCRKLRNISIPPVPVIEEGLFMDCAALENMSVSENTVSISDNAFAGCTSLKSISIPSKVRSIAVNAFNGCISLESIDVDENNQYYADDNGILFNKDMSGLIKYPPALEGEKYTVNAGIIAENAFRECGKLNEIEFAAESVEIGGEAFRKSSLKRIVLGGNIRTEGFYLFAECERLEEAVFDGFSGDIGVGMFYGCTALKKIALPEGTKKTDRFAFRNCVSLAEISFPESLEEIGAEAFLNCAELVGADIPKNVSYIKESAFYGCTGMEYINISPENEIYSSEDGVLFDADKTRIIRYPSEKGTEYTLPASVETIGFGAFEGAALENMRFETPSSLKTIEDEAFCRCKNIETIKFPKGLVTIGSRVFMGCSSLRSADFPNSAEKMGDSVFDSCIRLEFFDMPAKMSYIGNAVFYNCPALYDIRVADGNKSYMSEDGILFNKKQTELIQYPADKWDTEYIIPGKVIKIAWYAFYHCNELEYVIIPQKVKEIGFQAFFNCARLTDIYVEEGNKSYTSIEGVLFDGSGSELIQYPAGRYDEQYYEIPDGTESIYPYAFYNAKTEIITFPESLREIGLNAFYRCKQLSVLVLTEGVEKIGSGAFRCCDNLLEINYTGTAGKWEQIVNDAYTDSRSIICRDEVIPQKEIAGSAASVSGGEIPYSRNNGRIIVDADEQSRVYAAVYDDDGVYLKAYVFEPEYADNGALTYEHNMDTAGNIELMIWDENMSPLTKKILIN